MMNSNQFTDIKGYEGLYQINRLGEVKSLKNNIILKQGLDSSGYYTIVLCKDKKKRTNRIHRLVGETFIPNPDNLNCIDHINRDKTDNKLSNLRWVSYSQNNFNKTKKGCITIKKDRKKKFRFCYYLNKKQYNLYFYTLEEAKEAQLLYQEIVDFIEKY